MRDSIVYEQSTGKLYCGGTLMARGYSGHGVGKNNPRLQHVRNTGPIPQGWWRLGPAYNHPTKGGCVIPLIACSGTVTFGRSGFLVHGDSRSNPGEASEGCIILPHSVRERLSRDRVELIQVVELMPEAPNDTAR